MTRNHLIFTHAAVFSVGIAAAMIASRAGEPHDVNAAHAASSASRGSSRAGGGSQESGGVAGSGKTKESNRTGSGRPTAAPVERLGEIVRITD